MAAAAALRSAARKVSGRAFEQQSQRLLLPRIGRGGSSLRRFSSSQSPSVLNNSKQQGTKPAATKAEEVLKNDAPASPWSPDNPKLRSNVMRAIAGAVIAGTAIYCLETMYIFRDTYEMEEAPKKNAD